MGTPHANSSEYLIYQLIQPICIVSAIEILPYKARFQAGMPIYAPMLVTVTVSYDEKCKGGWKSRPYVIQNLDGILFFKSFLYFIF